MGDLPLRTPTDRRHGGPLPRHLPNRTHPHPPPRALVRKRCRKRTPWGVNFPFGRLFPSGSQVGYVLLTHSPVAGRVLLPPDAPRLACVKPVASVHPEPGSNSPLYSISGTPQRGSARMSVLVKMPYVSESSPNGT